MNGTSLDLRRAALVVIAMFVVYNANGREIGTYDSQPTKFAAREFLLRGSLSLNHVVGATPEYIDRSGFQLAQDGRFRSAYSPVPALVAAALIWPLWKSGVIDLREPSAHNLVSAIASSFLVALAVGVAYVIARLDLLPGRALLVTAALGVGTGLWSTASQTLWQHETAVFGLMVAVLAVVMIDRLQGPATRGFLSRAALWALVLGLSAGVAAGARLQLLPTVAVLLTAVFVRAGWRIALVAAVASAAIILPVCAANLRWFGSPLGAAPMLEALHESVHASTGSFSIYSGGISGLLVSPNRGLLIFSPVVLVAALGWRQLAADRDDSALVWCTVAACAQFALYASYVVWWGGHTFGPRYMLDVLPLLLPLGIAGAARLHGRIGPSLALAALAWSIGVAALGAFNYPEGRWNTDPVDVDRHHDRLWDWHDTQIARTWQAGPSPQNFSLFTHHAARRPGP